MRMQTDPAFIYPAWLRAKIDLFEKLLSLGPLTGAQQSALQSWFESHVFELGVDHFTSDYELARMREYDEHAPKEIRRRAAHNMLLQTVFTKGLYLEQSIPNRDGQTMRTTLLICGVPTALGPAERKRF